MGLLKSLQTIEKKSAWSFFGFLLAIIFGGIAIYTSFFQNKIPNMQIIVESNTSVLDIKKDIKNLDILYKGINIKKQQQNLSIFSIKVINNSNVTILKEFYDELSPVRISVKHGHIVDKPQITETSNDYLGNNLSLVLDTTGTIFLPKLIMEGQEYFSINLLILHEINLIPEIIAKGKIAGQIHGIDVLENYQLTSDLTFWQKLAQGNLSIHIIRFLGYLFTLIIIFVSVAIPSVLISDSYKKAKKKRRIKNYKLKKEIENSPETDAVFDLYLDRSLDYLIKVQKLLANEPKLKIMLRGVERREKRIEKDTDLQIQYERDVILREHDLNQRPININYVIAKRLKEENIVQFDSNNITINKKYQKELSEFISYLKLI